MEPVVPRLGAQGAVEGGRDDSGVTLVRLVGEIDISNAERLGAKLDDLIGGSSDRLVIDLSGLSFMDSSGIAMLLRAAGRVESIAVRHPTDAVRRVIECTGLADVLPMEP